MLYQPSPFTPKIPLYKILKAVKQSGGHSVSGFDIKESFSVQVGIAGGRMA